MSEEKSSLPLSIVIRGLLNVGLVWFMSTSLGSYFLLTGGWPAIIIVGVLLMALNIVVRPILAILTLPLRFFATALAAIVVNGIFVQIIYEITQRLDPALVTLQIGGGIVGWIVVATVLGVGNWLMKLVLK